MLAALSIGVCISPCFTWVCACVRRSPKSDQMQAASACLVSRDSWPAETVRTRRSGAIPKPAQRSGVHNGRDDGNRSRKKAAPARICDNPSAARRRARLPEHSKMRFRMPEDVWAGRGKDRAQQVGLLVSGDRAGSDGDARLMVAVAGLARALSAPHILFMAPQSRMSRRPGFLVVFSSLFC